MARVHLGRWSWAFVTFRIADGATSVLFPLGALLRYDLTVAGAAGVVALLNLGSVPATLTWCRIMDRHPARRRITILGLSVASLAFASLAFPLPLWGYLIGAVAAVAFGVATAPAAGILVLEGRERKEWAAATGTLSRRSAGAYLVGQGTVLVLGLTGTLDTRWVFAGAAVVAIVAAFVAARTIVPRAQRPDVEVPAPETVSSQTIRSARRLERAFFFPSRLRFRPDLPLLHKPHVSQGIIVGIVVMFMGTLTFFSGYQGAMVNVLHLSAGLVVLAESGSHVANTIAFSWAGGYGSQRGEPAAIRLGLTVRLVALGVLIGGVLSGGSYVILVLLAGGILMGVSFSLLHVNLPVFLASLEPGRGSSAVGAYHTAVAVGVLSGSIAGFVTNVFLPLWAVYLTAWLVLALGMFLVLRGVGRAVAPRPL